MFLQNTFFWKTILFLKINYFIMLIIHIAIRLIYYHIWLICTNFTAWSTYFRFARRYRNRCDILGIRCYTIHIQKISITSLFSYIFLKIHLQLQHPPIFVNKIMKFHKKEMYEKLNIFWFHKIFQLSSNRFDRFDINNVSK